MYVLRSVFVEGKDVYVITAKYAVLLYSHDKSSL